jgi:hypothetical protein
MTDVNRIKQLAGIREDQEADDLQKLNDYEQQESREKVMKQQIAESFKSLGLAITRIDYDEHPARSAMVVLDDEPLGWSLEKLASINQLDFISNVKIVPYNDVLEVHFTVK